MPQFHLWMDTFQLFQGRIGPDGISEVLFREVPSIGKRRPKMSRFESLILLLKVSRPLAWAVLPLVFCMGLVLGEKGVRDASFQFTPLMIIQMLSLSFPFCLMTYGVNDVFDCASDRMNPRKGGFEGARLQKTHHRLLIKAAVAAGVFFITVSLLTQSLLNVFYAFSMLVLAGAYSIPPWRLKVRAPLDVVTAGIIGVLGPFALGYGYVDDAAHIPLQVYYFSLCVMGFHAFSTIMDYRIDKKQGDRTFAVAYGKRAAALFPALVLLFSPAVLRETCVRVFCLFCLAVFICVAVYPSERIARFSFWFIYIGALLTLPAWAVFFFIKG